MNKLSRSLDANRVVLTMVTLIWSLVLIALTFVTDASGVVRGLITAWVVVLATATVAAWTIAARRGRAG